MTKMCMGEILLIDSFEIPPCAREARFWSVGHRAGHRPENRIHGPGHVPVSKTDAIARIHARKHAYRWFT